MMAPCEVRPPSREQHEVREQHRFAPSDPGELALLCSPQCPNGPGPLRFTRDLSPVCLCAYGDTWQPMAVVRDGMVAGFGIYGIDDDGSAWIGGLLIDQSQQRTGAARAAVSALIDRFTGNPGVLGSPGTRVSWDGPQLCARQCSCTSSLPILSLMLPHVLC